MTITIRYFAALREDFGIESESLPIAGAVTPTAILIALGERHPDRADLLRVSRIAVADAFVAADETVPAGSEVAIIPPVSGG